MKKNVLYITIFVLLLGYYGYDQLYPQYEQWGKEIETVSKNLSQARSNAPNLADMQKEEMELKKRLKASLTKLPSASELSDLLAMITPLLENIGISSSDIGTKNVEAPIEKDIYRIHPIKLLNIKKLSMSKIVRLLYEIRQFHRIINVATFVMRRTGQNEYDIDLNLETYSYIEDEGDVLNLEDVQLDEPAAPTPTESGSQPAEESDTILTTPINNDTSGTSVSDTVSTIDTSVRKTVETNTDTKSAVSAASNDTPAGSRSTERR